MRVERVAAWATQARSWASWTEEEARSAQPVWRAAMTSSAEAESEKKGLLKRMLRGRAQCLRGTGQRCFHDGGRFSRNAFSPSVASSVRMSSWR